MNIKHDFEVVIIGSGAIGIALARESIKSGKKTLLVEKNSFFGEETSSRNSEVIHSGIYYPKDSKKKYFCLDGSRLLYKYLKLKKLPYKRIGKIIFSSEKNKRELESLFENARKNNVPNISFLEGNDLKSIEPTLNAKYGILSKNTGIFDSHAFIKSLDYDFHDMGGISVLRTKFLKAKLVKNEIIITLENPDGSIFEITSKNLVNSAGASSCEVSRNIHGFNQALPEQFLVKGNYFTTTQKNPFNHLIYPLPDNMGLGIHSTSDLNGKLKFGPDVDTSDTNLTVNLSKKNIFFKNIKKYWKEVQFEKLEPDYVGLRPKIKFNGILYKDFFCETIEVKGCSLISLHGIESPGLTSSLSLARLVNIL